MENGTKEKVMKLLTELIPSVDFTCDRLVCDGMLDSIMLIDVISGLDDEFKIEISLEEITAENFNNIDAIAALVDKYKGES